MKILRKIRLFLFGNCPLMKVGYRCQGIYCADECDWKKAAMK